MSKLFRNVPLRTQAITSPESRWWFPLFPGGRREAGAERRPTGVPYHQGCRAPPRQGPAHTPDPLPPPRGASPQVGFPAAPASAPLAAPTPVPASTRRRARASCRPTCRHFSCTPRRSICTVPSRSARTVTFRPRAQRFVSPVQWIPLTPVLHRPVARHQRRLFPTQPLVPAARHAAVRIRRTGRCLLKLPVVFRQIGPGQRRVRSRQVADPGPPPRLGRRADHRAGAPPRQGRAGHAILPRRPAAHPLLLLPLHRGQAVVEQEGQRTPAQRVDPRPHCGVIVARVAKPQPHVG